MQPKPKELKQIILNESALVYDESLHNYDKAFITTHRRTKAHLFVDEILFNATGETYTSDPFECIAYQKGLLLINLDVTSAPTDIYFKLQFSDNNVDYYNYALGPFADLRYEDAAGDKKECLNFPIIAPFMRIYVVSSGCDANNTFLVTVKCILNG